MSTLKPRYHYRPPLAGLSNIFMLLTYLGVGVVLLAIIGAVLTGDPVGIAVVGVAFGGTLLSAVGWVLVYLARTLDDIGFSVGARADALPVPPPHVP